MLEKKIDELNDLDFDPELTSADDDDQNISSEFINVFLDLPTLSEALISEVDYTLPIDPAVLATLK